SSVRPEPAERAIHPRRLTDTRRLIRALQQSIKYRRGGDRSGMAGRGVADQRKESTKGCLYIDALERMWGDAHKEDSDRGRAQARYRVRFSTASHCRVRAF